MFCFVLFWLVQKFSQRYDLLRVCFHWRDILQHATEQCFTVSLVRAVFSPARVITVTQRRIIWATVMELNSHLNEPDYVRNEQGFHLNPTSCIMPQSSKLRVINACNFLSRIDCKADCAICLPFCVSYWRFLSLIKKQKKKQKLHCTKK